MAKLLEIRDELLLRREHGLFDDFYWYISPHMWTSFVADSGSGVALASTTTNTGGVLSLTPGTTDNNECAVSTTNKPFLFLNERPLLFEAAIQYAEANTSAMNAFVGFSSVLGTANMLLDDGAGPAASFSGAGIFKVDGGTVWKFVTSLGTTQTITTSQHTAGGSAYQTLRVEVRQGSSGASGLEAIPWLGTGTPSGATTWQQMLDANNKPIKHAITYTSAVNMQAGVYVKEGSTSAETMLVDYIGAYQLRS